MSAHDARQPEASRDGRSWALFIALGVFLLCICAVLAGVSFQFSPDSNTADRPVLAVLGLFGLAFFCYVIAIPVALGIRQTGRLLGVILVMSVLMRAVLLFSWPILEIDIYRYIWDGTVVSQGISPYRYSPEQVRSAVADSSLPDDLRRLVEVRNENAVREDILSRVHYGELPTIYPPVSQAIFSAAVFMTPSKASVFTHVVVMKSLLVLFDLLTVGVIIGLLQLAGKPIGWSVAYAWCPLVLKETANTGHLDSLAVFLTTVALYVALRPLGCRAYVRSRPASVLSAALILALAVGAKLYPIVLLPMFVVLWNRVQGWRWASGATVVFVAVTAVLLWPMVPKHTSEAARGNEQASGSEGQGVEGIPPPPVETSDSIPPPTVDLEPQDPSTGLRAFLRRWEMNDFLFMIMVENLKPQGDTAPGSRAWFSFVPQQWKATLSSIAAKWSGVEQPKVAFLLARLVSGSVFLVLVVVLVWRRRRSADPVAWLRVAFLILAWLWLLSPTQNPWYWTWALPLVMFARSRAWLAMSGLVMLYYARFWFDWHCSNQPLLGTPYSGAAFFDYVVTWIEFGPWFLGLALEAICRTACKKPPSGGN